MVKIENLEKKCSNVFVISASKYVSILSFTIIRDPTNSEVLPKIWMRKILEKKL